ncbi:protein of unknown function [Cupriavidus taiwanensis]|uniref:Uncharacterized protein n=1 Tax=Cupriavidus taiwanensis TaxID=164546 RepID=A0A7Z7J9G0_9BURK|nr:protein of unknown function [Cupriavidus taiwanensis]SOZ03040.1 hypothetical protein CBM2597_A110104 [Cupriavidus taiwanensis]SOZ06315.1 hypothetical protein CBM2595_A81000 [Cupriavidus taiwanensis]SPC18846.1 hypothetical protein CBM2594_A80285 [Cupriavidus taiwanensis]SPD41262.1 protein of unknown function [Cupriavidus taiwanensis]
MRFGVSNGLFAHWRAPAGGPGLPGAARICDIITGYDACAGQVLALPCNLRRTRASYLALPDAGSHGADRRLPAAGAAGIAAAP